MALKVDDIKEARVTEGSSHDRTLVPVWLVRACKRNGFAIAYSKAELRTDGPPSYTVKICQAVKVAGIPGFEGRKGYRDGDKVTLGGAPGKLHKGRKAKVKT